VYRAQPVSIDKAKLTVPEATARLRVMLKAHVDEGLTWTEIGSMYRCERDTLRNIHVGKRMVGPIVAKKFHIELVQPPPFERACIMCGRTFGTASSKQICCGHSCAHARSAWRRSKLRGVTKAATAEEWFAYVDRLTQQGTCNPRAKVTAKVAKLIYEMAGTQKDIGKVFGVSASCVSHIKRGTAWRRVNC
jgi:predicted XRE-type DNA-binding protein